MVYGLLQKSENDQLSKLDINRSKLILKLDVFFCMLVRKIV